MRIPRTNFPPAAFGDTDNDDQAGEPLEWHRNDYADDPRPESAPRPRTVAELSGRTADADGNWENHFFLAPNVRFTRTPDRDIHGRQPGPSADVALTTPAETPVETIVAANTGAEQISPQRPLETPAQARFFAQVRETLNRRSQQPPVPVITPATVGNATETMMMLQGRMDARRTIVAAAQSGQPIVAPIAPMGMPVQPAAEAPSQQTTRAWSAMDNLSEFAFWESEGYDGEPTSSGEVARLSPTAAARAEIAIPAGSIATMFRIIECRVPRALKAPDVVRFPYQATTAAPAAAPGPVRGAVVPKSIPAPVFKAEIKPVVTTPVAEQMPASPVIPAPSYLAPASVVEPVRQAAAASGVAISKPFQIDPRSNLRITHGEYEFPPRALLQDPPETVGFVMSQEQLERNAGLLESVLEDFGVRGEIIHVRPGPVVTLYEFEPAPGVKSSRVIGLADDIARSMSALSARVAVVPGRNVIGIELPNATRETVYFGEMIDSPDFSRNSFKLPICLGKTIGGEPVIAELAKMPHLLVAGTTGSGKSVAINTMILSLLYRLTPEECRLIMVDPKMLELSVYDGIPHLLTPVVTDPKKAVLALKWAVREMEDRYRKMSKLGVRNIDGYNARAALAREKGETISMIVQTGFEKGTGEPIHENQDMDLAQMPYIVVIVDEMADLMMVAGKEIEGAIQRLAQMARAAGIHLIMATQRPSVDVITGTIKANFPTRISFQVTSKIDSRTILGEMGAEQLLGQGDMLHMAGGGRISRVHGPFVSDEEVEKVVAHLKTQGRPDYLETVTTDEDSDEVEEADTAVFDKGDMAAEDGNDLYDKAVKVVLRDKKCSTSYIQRRLGIGYNRAASLVERMEKEGLVGSANHVGKREIISANRDASPMESGDFSD